jgi:hypothetical protein
MPERQWERDTLRQVSALDWNETLAELAAMNGRSVTVTVGAGDGNPPMTVVASGVGSVNVRKLAAFFRVMARELAHRQAS